MNDVEEGGETIFYNPEESKIKPTQGTLLLFNPGLDHEGAVPTSSEKCILVTWFVNKEEYEKRMAMKQK